MRALTSLGARVQALPPGRADLLLAGAFLLETQVELSFLDASAGTVLAARGLTIVMACGVAARRLAPLLAAALVFAALTVMEQLHGPVNTSLVGPYISAFIVSYSVGANLEGRRLAIGTAWLVVLVTVMAALDPSADDGVNLVWGWLVVVAAPVLAGRLLHERARLARSLRVAAGEDDGGTWAAQAVAEERSRIAADLHDVVARAMGRMVVDADGAAALVDAEPARAALAFAAVEQTGRDALTEIRRLLGVLRREDDERVRYGDDHVVVEVRDNGRRIVRPLPGVRERVLLYGGELHAGVRRGGGHGVRARLPLGGLA